MKKTLKIISFIILFFLLLLFAFIIYCVIVSSKYNLDEFKLQNVDNCIIRIYDKNNKVINNDNVEKYVTYDEINKNTINAFVSIEDKRFYKHKGIDNKAIFRALFNNIKSFSFKEGASTITQQLVKNTHLTNEKTVKRKIVEGKIARQIEKKYSKEEIIEMYLNNIYFGDNCYGIYKASKHYFDKEPIDLTTNESACLAGLVKSPYYYSPTKNAENSYKRKNIVLTEMLNQGYISNEEFEFCKSQKIKVNTQKRDNKIDYLSFFYDELDKLLDENYVYTQNLEVYTTVDLDYQKILESNLYEFNNLSDSCSGIIMEKNGGIVAYSSSLGDVKRQIGSIIKPILIYAPAFEYNIINESTIINDELSNFDGLNITNYNDKYVGKTTAKQGLVNSSNTLSAKILSSVGINNAKNCIKDLPLELNEKDNNLLLSIGSTNQGQKLSNITCCYLPFLNDGYSRDYYLIEKIIDMNGNVFYKHNSTSKKIFGDDTTYLMNDCLNDCVKYGTAKKLKNVSENLCAKTGTVGNSNGNMDAYSICYDVNIISSIWLGNEKGELMSNSVTGGTYPTIINKNIFENIYKQNGKQDFFNMPSSIEKVKLDYYSLHEDDKEEIVLENVPNLYLESALYKKCNTPKYVSTRFSSPKIESVKLSVYNNGFNVSLCHAQYIDFTIYDEYNGLKKCIYNSQVNGNINSIDFNKTNDNFIHKISIVPYFNQNIGEEIFLGNVKFESIIEDDWWIN